MVKTTPLLTVAFGAVLVVFLLTGGTAQEESPDVAVPREIEHGRYIVHNVCLCTVCHSPRDSDGELVESRLLTGGAIPVASPFAEGEWAFRAPKIAGLPAGWTKEEFTEFLQSGEAPHGRAVRAPMPAYRLNERDARAVAAYLLSVR